MSAYIIARIRIDNNEMYDRYKAQTPGLAKQFGGEFIVRGGRFELLEGDSAELDRTVVIRFPSYDAAQLFYHSTDYQAIIDLRRNASKSEILLVEGA